MAVFDTSLMRTRYNSLMQTCTTASAKSNPCANSAVAKVANAGSPHFLDYVPEDESGDENPARNFVVNDGDRSLVQESRIGYEDSDREGYMYA